MRLLYFYWADRNNKIMCHSLLKIACLCLLLSSCAVRPPELSKGHIAAESSRSAVVPRGVIPQPVKQAAPLSPPKPTTKLDTYSVVVTSVSVPEILFALARDARLNLDIHPGIRGSVTLNAIEQTLPQILKRIARQVDIRYEVDGANLSVMPDTPFLRHYKIDYVNMSRDATGTVGIATQISTPGSTGSGGAGGASGGVSGGSGNGGNISLTSIANVAKNRFWETLEKNLRDILRETDKILPEGSPSPEEEEAETALNDAERRSEEQKNEANQDQSPDFKTVQAAQTEIQRKDNAAVKAAKRALSRAKNIPTFREAASVIANPEAGIIMVRATGRQHERVQEFIDSVMSSARKQVLIEATIVEVALNQNFQKGIDWQYLQSNRVAVGQGPATTAIDALTGALMPVIGPAVVAGQLFTAAFREGGFTSTIKLLETFGTIKVVSSPKLSVLNNQTAILKVVDNLVYFTVRANVSQSQFNVVNTFTSTPNTVSVGFVMSVTPQIGDDDSVLLNLRPTISRTIGPGKQDPNPQLVNVVSMIPEIQTREMESLIKVNNGDIAVMGGLMQDDVDNRNATVPGAASLPLIGYLFQQRNETARKTELVIFVRPVVIKEASLDGDYKHLRETLPKENFLVRPLPIVGELGAVGALGGR
ncbi:MAG: type II and III secretion system protein [Nitrosomonadales bacterium]|nr:MAG: type II and III secretion system protein [Nitrosomonadales bacterium]